MARELGLARLGLPAQLGHVEGVEGREPLHALLQPAMRVEQARVKVKYGLPN